MKLLYDYSDENLLKFLDHYERLYGKPDFKVGDAVVMLPKKNQNYKFIPMTVTGFDITKFKNHEYKKVICRVDPFTFRDRRGREHKHPGYSLLFSEYEIIKIKRKS